MTTTTEDLLIAINLDRFTRLQMKHMLLTLLANMTTEQAETLLNTIGMDNPQLTRVIHNII
jgi:hypothetical protein